jgi:hypothetical protein
MRAAGGLTVFSCFLWWAGRVQMVMRAMGSYGKDKAHGAVRARARHMLARHQ